MATKTKKAKTFPCVVATLTVAEIKQLNELEKAERDGMIGAGLGFEDLDERIQSMKMDFWHALYKTHKLDPQRDYTIDAATHEVVQMSGQRDPDTI